MLFLFKDCLQNVIQVETQVTFNSLNCNPDVVSSNTTTNMIAAATVSAATTSTSTIASTTVTTSSVVPSSIRSSSTSPVQPVQNVSSENCKDTEIVCLLHLTEMIVALEYQFSCCHAYIQCIS